MPPHGASGSPHGLGQCGVQGKVWDTDPRSLGRGSHGVQDADTSDLRSVLALATYHLDSHWRALSQDLSCYIYKVKPVISVLRVTKLRSGEAM